MIWYNGGTISDYYTIDLDGQGPIEPFPVYCDFTGDTPRSIIHHNQETRSKTVTTKGTYNISISYKNNDINITTSQVMTFVDLFANCSYHYKHECSENHLKHSYWVDRHRNSSNKWEETSTLCQPGNSEICFNVYPVIIY